MVTAVAPAPRTRSRRKPGIRLEMVDERYGRRRALGSLRMTQTGPRLIASARERLVTDSLLRQLAYQAALEGVSHPDSVEGPFGRLAQLVRELVAAASEQGDVARATRDFRNALLHERARAVTQLERHLEVEPGENDDALWVPGDDLSRQRDEILGWGGRGALTALQAMHLLGLTTRQGLSRRRHARQLLGLPLGERRFAYPRWQFDGSGSLIPGLKEILASAPSDDPWGLADLLTTPQRSLGGEAPIDALRNDVATALPKILGILERTYT